jgi:hypothetical protein
MCNDTQSNHQLQQEEQQMQELLTYASYSEWVNENYNPYDKDEHQELIDNPTMRYSYLVAHGLPLDSIIEGL